MLRTVLCRLTAIGLPIILCELALSLAIRDGVLFGRELVPYELVNDDQAAALTALLTGEPTYIRFCRTLGWTVRENGASLDGKRRANSAGIRSLKEYDLRPRSGTLRIAAFGDSYTHCDGVCNEESWPFLLEETNPRWEVLNFGVGGYGPDQAYLRWKTLGKHYSPHVVLAGFWLGDVNRVVNRFRPFMQRGTGVPLGKPRFVFRGNKLELIENPLEGVGDVLEARTRPWLIQKIGTGDYWFARDAYSRRFGDRIKLLRVLRTFAHRLRYKSLVRRAQFKPGEEPLAVLCAVLKQFHDDVLQAGQHPIILVFPGGSDFVEMDRTGAKYWQPLINFLERHDLQYYDLADGLRRYAADRSVGASDLFEAHYTALGNRAVAELVGERVRLVYSGAQVKAAR